MRCEQALRVFVLSNTAVCVGVTVTGLTTVPTVPDQTGISTRLFIISGPV